MRQGSWLQKAVIGHLAEHGGYIGGGLLRCHVVGQGQALRQLRLRQALLQALQMMPPVSLSFTMP